MIRTIAVVDHASGETSDRASNTPTVDVPPDFDQTTSAAQLDPTARLHYSTLGVPAVRPAFTRPLSWRAHGEQCLVEETGKKSKDGGTIKFLLSTIEQLPFSALSRNPSAAPRPAADVGAPARRPARVSR